MSIALYITIGIAAINLATLLFGRRLAQYRRRLDRAQPSVVTPLLGRLSYGAK